MINRMCAATMISIAILIAGLTGCQNQSATKDMVLERAELEIALPKEALDLYLILPGENAEEDGSLVSVYEKQSYEEFLTDYDIPFQGFLFGICRSTAAKHEAYLCSDGSGLRFFAKDDTYYYGQVFPTDVQFYRSEIESYDNTVFTPWDEANSYIAGILADFITRNGLTPHSDEDFFQRKYTYDGEHIFLLYDPYYPYDNPVGEEILVLSQPVEQGEGGIWCVERIWHDSYETMNYVFPAFYLDTDMAAEEHFMDLQSKRDRGGHPELSDPMAVAMIFVNEYYGRNPLPDALTRIDGDPFP